MKPLLPSVVALCLIVAATAIPKNIEDVKELPQSKDPVLEAEESDPQTRAERCTTCAGLSLKSPNEILAQIQALPGAEVHTQQSFEGCSSDKGCAGIKVKDGRVLEKFGNLDAFRAAAAADAGNEFTFHAAGGLGNVFEGGASGDGPFWWMNQNSPFKNTGGNFEKFSKSSSSFSSSGSGGGASGSGSFTGSLDLGANPFLNGEFSKLAGSIGQTDVKPSSFQSSSFESSSFSSSNKGDIDLTKNPFLNGGFKGGFQAGGSQGFGQTGFGTGSQGAFQSGSKFSSTGYTGSSPSPFTASTAGTNVNLIQNTQKTSEFDFEQQQQTQQNIDEAFQSTGNVHAHETSGGDLQQTCAGQGYVCVHKAQCNNGVVNQNGAAILQAKTKKQYCNTKTEICCRIETSTLSGAGGLQGSLGVGSGTFSSQGSGLFVSSNQGSSQTGSGAQGFGQSGSGFGSTASSFESSSSVAKGRGSAFGAGSFGATGSQGSFASGRGVESSSSSANFGATGKFGASGTFGANFGSTAAPGNTGGNEVVYKQTSQSNFIETDSFSSGSENAGVFRPGSGSGLKPGIPYLPPVDNSNSGSSVVSTAYPTTFTPRPPTQKPTYLPPVASTSAPGYLPPQVPDQTINTETRVPSPNYNEGQLILDETRQPQRPKVPISPGPIPQAPSEIPAGCAAALKCTPIEYCTAEGVISNTTVVLSRDQDAYRVPLTDCKDVETSRIGKCCRDPFYTDPWPTNQLGKWVPGVFGGNDGKYTPDTRGSGSIVRTQVTARPPSTGSTILNNFITPKPTVPAFGPNQVTPGFPSSTVSQGSYQKGQFEIRGQGQYGQAGQGQYAQGGQGQFGVASQGSQFGQGSRVTSGFGQTVTQGQGQLTTQGQGQLTTQGQGQISTQGQGQISTQGQGQISTQGQFEQNQGQFVQRGQGQFVQQGQGQYSQGGRGQFGVGGGAQIGVQGQAQGQISQTQKGFGQAVIQGQGQAVSQGFGSGIRQGGGLSVSQGAGFGVENDYSESVQRVFLQQYNAGGQCGVFNGQKPYGNRNELEVDFGEIPWQAMVLLQTNRSLLCGGVITRPDVVVTSASCVDGLDAKNVLIKGGEWKLGIDDEPLPFQIVQVKNILRHPFYKRGSLQYDAAILVLTENLRLAKNIYPICLPRAGETLDAFYNGAGECIVTGWGKQVLQAHLAGSIMHSLNVSLINPGECQAKLSQDYPHLLEQYDQESCACGQPTNPVNNICRVDTGSALACTTDNSHYVLRGVYSWDSGCQPGNQLAAFYKFDLEWYEWAIGLIESARFAQYSSGAQILSSNRFAGQINSGIKSGQTSGGVKGGQISGVKGAAAGGVKGFGSFGQGQSFGQGFSQGFSQFSSANSGAGSFGAEIKGPVANSFSASFSEKKVFQTEPKIVTFTTKPEIVTFTTKPEFFTYTTKPKLVTYTTKPQIITYETSGSGNNPQYVAPGVTFNPSFPDVVGAHSHTSQCKCLENGK